LDWAVSLLCGVPRAEEKLEWGIRGQIWQIPIVSSRSKMRRSGGTTLLWLFAVLCSVPVADGGIEDYFNRPSSDSMDADEFVAHLLHDLLNWLTW
jgi:hypothetical protein